MRLSEIAGIVGGEISGSAEVEIGGVAKIEEAGGGEITFLANPKYRKHLATTGASAVLVARGADIGELSGRPSPISVIRVDDPYRAFLKLLDRFHPPPEPLDPGVHRTAIVGPGARIGEGAAIGAYAVIGAGCSVGPGVSIHAGTVLGREVEIGAASVLHANVTVQDGCKIGLRVIIHPGAVIGSDGFGFAPREDGSYEKIPQRGIVVIEDDVEIGANCTIDRATLGQTLIRRGTKLDNLIHVAHNVAIGEHTVIAAQTGISGSTKVGNHCAIAGQVGLSGHIEIADHTTIGAQSGVPKSILEPGKSYVGYPVRESRRTWRIEAILDQLPALLEEIRSFGRRLKDLEDKKSHQ